MIHLADIANLRREVNQLKEGRMGDIKPHADEKDNVALVAALKLVQLSERMDEIEKKLDQILSSMK